MQFQCFEFCSYVHSTIFIVVRKPDIIQIHLVETECPFGGRLYFGLGGCVGKCSDQEIVIEQRISFCAMQIDIRVVNSNGIYRYFAF